MELIEIMDVIFQCSLTKNSRASFMLELIDNMMIEGAKNPFEGSAEDTLNRIFLGTNPFPKAKAKKIYSHKDEARFSHFIRGLGDDVVFNIEDKLQKTDNSYEQDDTCFNLAVLVFEKLSTISEKAHTIKTTTPKAIEEDDDEVFRQVQAFCIDYEEELELLPLCQIAVFLNPMHKYVREMYTDYCKCPVAVRKKILEINGCRSLEFSDKGWIAKSLNLFDEKAREKNLCTTNYLYDGAKYFLRAFERYSEYPIDFDPWIFEHLIKYESPLFSRERKCNLHTYISEYLELSMSGSDIKVAPPLDSMWAHCSKPNVPEYEVTYWVCMAMIATSPQLAHSVDDNYDLCDVDLCDAESLISTQEDMYLYALLELYKLHRKLC